MIFEKIEKLAKERKISIAKLMRSVDISEGSYYNMRSRNDISIETLKKFAVFFNTTLSFFVSDDELPLPAVGKEESKAKHFPVLASKELEDIAEGKWIDYATRKLIERLENDLKKAEEREAYLVRQNDALMAK